MVYALWATLLFVSASGILLDGDPLGQNSHQYGEEYGNHAEAEEESDHGELIEEIHEVSANLLLLLAPLHVGGVIIESRLSGRNLIRAMISGGLSSSVG